MAWTIFWFLIPHDLLLSRARPCLTMGFSFFILLFFSFRSHATIPARLPCYSCCSVIWPQLAGLLLGLLHIPLSIGYNDPVWSLDLCLCYFGLSWPITLFVSSFVPFFSSLGIFSPFFNYAFPWVFTNSFGFSGLITYPLSLRLMHFPSIPYFITLGLLWPIITFLHHIMPMSLLLLSLGFFRPICFSQVSFIYFLGLGSIIPAIWV